MDLFKVVLWFCRGLFSNFIKKGKLLSTPLSFTFLFAPLHVLIQEMHKWVRTHTHTHTHLCEALAFRQCIYSQGAAGWELYYVDSKRNDFLTRQNQGQTLALIYHVIHRKGAATFVEHLDHLIYSSFQLINRSQTLKLFFPEQQKPILFNSLPHPTEAQWKQE